ncbi:MAG: type II toxin-antitoxin system prevent-host-death family antitoxin [Gammaproteobacteria bacterium]|nr:type II toxin-antitoxin system prevent-host-death family antitoxin [Gammaproteobacteria bacterium]
MKTMTSSEARQDFSAVIDRVADEETVTISRRNKDVAVMISSARYKELKRIEDILYVKAAELAIKEGFASDKETKEIMDKLGANEV